MNGVKYILLLEVSPTVCKKDAQSVTPLDCLTDDEAETLTCQVHYLQRPWISKAKFITSNNCTKSQQFALYTGYDLNTHANDIDINDPYKHENIKKKVVKKIDPNFERMAETGQIDEMDPSRLSNLESQIIPESIGIKTSSVLLTDTLNDRFVSSDNMQDPPSGGTYFQSSNTDGTHIETSFEDLSPTPLSIEKTLPEKKSPLPVDDSALDVFVQTFMFPETDDEFIIIGDFSIPTSEPDIKMVTPVDELSFTDFLHKFNVEAPISVKNDQNKDVVDESNTRLNVMDTVASSHDRDTFQSATKQSIVNPDVSREKSSSSSEESSESEESSNRKRGKRDEIHLNKQILDVSREINTDISNDASEESVEDLGDARYKRGEDSSISFDDSDEDKKENTNANFNSKSNIKKKSQESDESNESDSTSVSSESSSETNSFKVNVHNSKSSKDLDRFRKKRLTSRGPLLGGINDISVNDPTIVELSHEALKQLDATSSHANKYKVLEIISASRQVVAGIIYRVEVKIVLSDCLKTSDSNPSNCGILKESTGEVCKLEIWDQPWLPNGKQTNITCGNEVHSFRSKRSITSEQLTNEGESVKSLERRDLNTFLQFLDEHEKTYQSYKEFSKRYKTFR